MSSGFTLGALTHVGLNTRRPIFDCLILCVCLALSACANAPVSLGKVTPRSPVVATYGDSPLYAATDKYSFSQAEITYPAGGGHHTIQVGDFLLGEVLRTLTKTHRIVSLLRLDRFSSTCDASGVFLPTALCTTSYSISFTEEGVQRTIRSELEPIDIGHLRVRQDGLLGIVIGDDFFQEQIAPVLNSVVRDFESQLGTK